MTGKKLGQTNVVEHCIETEARLIRQQPYRVLITVREKMKEELVAMSTLGIIPPSRSPWASPVVLVEKKDGGLWFCVDYQKLNDVSKFDAYPMPRVEEVIESVGSAQILETCARDTVEEKTREMTALTTPFGFNVMLFGLHNMSATFQRMMNEVLKVCHGFARAYKDDVVIYSKTWGEHSTKIFGVFRKQE